MRASTAQEGQFDVVFRGIVAGRATWKATEAPGAYAVSALLQSTGLLRVIADIRYVAEVAGARSGDRFLPSRYREEANTGQRQQAAVMAFRRGVPVVESVSPPQPPGPNDLDPARERGVVDPLTALYTLLRDVPADKACTARATVFDGRRRSQVSLSRPQANGDRVTCAGEYRRLAGFSDFEMKERQRFPFALSYAPDGNGGLRVVEVVIETTYGPARLVRR
ncbi:MAG: DUF3108 domain-containing protein [Gemmobacter sp.]